MKKKPEGLARSGLPGIWKLNQFMAEQVAGLGTLAPHLWTGTVCLALPWPATANVVVQAVQVCFITVLVLVPARTWPPLARGFASVVFTSLHIGQGMAGAAATELVVEAFCSLSIWRSFGEALMPSSPTGLYWAGEEPLQGGCGEGAIVGAQPREGRLAADRFSLSIVEDANFEEARGEGEERARAGSGWCLWA